MTTRMILSYLLSSVFICGSVTLAQPADDADDDASPTTQPDEVRRGMRMGDPPETRYRRFWESLAQRIEPGRAGDAAKASVYLDFYRREILRDPRLFASTLRLSPAGGGKVAVEGAAEYREQLDALVALLRALNLEPDAAGVESMPTRRVADQPYGVIRASRSFLRSRPDGGENVNEAIGGEPVWVLDAAEGAVLCHSVDGYVGWIREAEVERVSAERFTSAINALGPQHIDKVDSAIENAKARLGKPYIWGGRSDDGVDCSGLVQQAFAAQGVHLPRDAEQQALVGRLVATRWHRDALRRGDLLYFLGRRGFIAHTAIYLGDGKLIESADGKVRISEFRPGLPRWESFCFAKRVLD